MVIIIPAYNPDEKLLKVLKDLKKKVNKKIVIVNDGSDERSDKIFLESKSYAEVLKHPSNKGKGAAMKTGLKYVKENMPEEDGVIFVDADGQHKANDVDKMIKEFEDNKDSLILGVRVFDKDVPFRSQFGNKLTRQLFKLYTHKYISDTQTGLRAVSTKHIPRLLRIEGNRYEYEMNMLIEFAKKKIPIKEVPIATIYEDKQNSTSHFNVIKDSYRIYKVFFKFIFSSVSSWLIDYLMFILLTLLLGKQGIFLGLCNVLARLISSSYNYLMNKKVVFKKGKKTLPKYIALAIFILIMNTILLYIFTNLFKIPTALAKLLVEVLLFFVSFTMQDRYIFKENEEE